MVSLPSIQASNTHLSSSLAPGLVAVFVGGTSGIGEATLKAFARYAVRPKIYIIGRSRSAAERIIAECRGREEKAEGEGGGEYVFLEKDVSLMQNVEEVCEVIKGRERCVDLLVLSCGVVSLDGEETKEGLPLLTALTFYARILFILRLLPLLLASAPTSPRRVLMIAGGTHAGAFDPANIPARNFPFSRLRGHLTTSITLALERLAKRAPEVSFVNSYPGTVDTNLMRREGGGGGWIRWLLRWYIWLFGRWVCIPIEESGERHFWLGTSGRFRARKGTGIGNEVEVDDGTERATRGTDGEVGSGVYAVGSTCEGGSEEMLELLKGYREKGYDELVLRHAEGEFDRTKRGYVEARK